MKKQRLSLRILVGIAVPAALLLGAAFFLRFGSPPCIFHALTGIYCPGCGAGRALRALTELRITDALQYNVFFTLSLPLAAVLLIKWYISFVSGREIWKKIRITDRGAIIYASVMLAFFILRNIPVVPFSYLSPDTFL